MPEQSEVPPLQLYHLQLGDDGVLVKVIEDDP